MLDKSPFSSPKGVFVSPLCCPVPYAEQMAMVVGGRGCVFVSLSLGFTLILSAHEAGSKHFCCEYSSVHPGTGGTVSLLSASWDTLNKTLG